MGLFKKFFAVKYSGGSERGVTRFQSRREAEDFARKQRAKGAKTEIKEGES